MKIRQYSRIMGQAMLKSALASGNPVVFGMQIYDSFFDAEGGHVPIPDPSREYYLGGHAMTFIGFDERHRHYIIQNSWGKSWGDGYLPYDAVRFPTIMDMWTAFVD